MSKIHPQEVEEASASASSASASASAWASATTVDCKKEEDVVQVYTIWMKSLILGGKGCTVYDSTGRLVYRVDNYHSKSTTELTLMDSRGKILCTLLRKNLGLCRVWEGFRAATSSSSSSSLSSSITGSNKLKHGAWFRVRKPVWKAFSSSCCEVKITMMEESVEEDENVRVPCRIHPTTNANSEHKKKKKNYSISTTSGRSSSSCSAAACTIVDSRGVVLAEVKRKQSAEGVVLGEDVSTLKLLHPNLDPLLIIPLLLSYALLFSRIMI
ncbi:hypothetical protein V2J09_005237 [Rumex salicifolius]